MRRVAMCAVLLAVVLVGSLATGSPAQEPAVAKPVETVADLQRMLNAAKNEVAADALAAKKAELERIHQHQAELNAKIAALKVVREQLHEVSPDRAFVLNCLNRNEGSPPYTNGIGEPTKKYRGRYQFDQGSWNDVATKYGFPLLIDIDPAAASPQEQDDMAWTYYQHSGTGPWPPSRGKC